MRRATISKKIDLIVMDHDNRSGTNKVTGIRQIVRLKGILQKWQIAALGPNRGSPRSAGSGISPAIGRRLRNSNACCDSDIEESCQSSETPPDVPRGYLAVYVGLELRRFIIPTGYLSDPLFKVLLEKAEDEFGFDHSGGLTIPCEIETFKYLVQCMENHMKEQCEDDRSQTY